MVKGVLCLCLIASAVAVALAVPTTTPLRVAACESDGCCRLEIQYSGTWGTVCNDNWGDANTRVACRQMGCGGTISYRTVGGGSGSTWLDGVDCAGTEASLASCSFNGWGIEDCTHDEDVGVCCCSAPTTPTATPAPTSTTSLRVAACQSDGCCRLEIQYSGSWGTICNDDWKDANTRVACRQMGCGGTVSHRTVGGGSGRIWLDGVDHVQWMQKSVGMTCMVEGVRLLGFRVRVF